ncbi:MAG: P-II family nitrogen regulator [Tissierellia bacterium]|nr:P-II family nitrogen regulator [Tissierellia bacterium]
MLDVKCIVAIVERGRADKVVNAAKKEGAKGATIFYGRGTGETEAKKFLKLHIESSKEIILILVEREKCKKIIEAMVEAGDIKKPGTGIIFTLEISDLIGLRHRKEFKE